MSVSRLHMIFGREGLNFKVRLHLSGHIILTTANEPARTLLIIDTNTRVVLNTEKSATVFCTCGDMSYPGVREWKIDRRGGVSQLFKFNNVYSTTVFVDICEALRYYADVLSEEMWHTFDDLLRHRRFDLLQTINHQRNGRGLVHEKTVSRDVMCLILLYLHVRIK